MNRSSLSLLIALLAVSMSAAARAQELAPIVPASAATTSASAILSPAASFPEALYARATPSLVAVDFTWAYEFGRIELVGPGVVVSSDGLVMVPGEVIGANLPDEQLKEFKIIVPGNGRDNEELEATFEGRDERNNVSFVRVKPEAYKRRDWVAVKFQDVPVGLGQKLYSVGLLAKAAGYRSFLTEATVSARIRGAYPQILVSGALASPGGVVFNEDGQAVGFVNMPQAEMIPYLYTSGGRREIDPMAPILHPPHLFTLTAEFAQALADPPTAAHPIQFPWVGLPQLTGITKDVALVFGLTNQPAIEISDVVPDSPAAAAGLKTRQIIVKMDGKPLARGDEPEELPDILHRQLSHKKPGDKVTFSVLTKKGQPLEDITVTLGPRPPRPNVAKRFYAEDLGYGVREITFDDTYRLKKPQDFKGVVVTILKQSGAAQSAKLSPNDVIADMNNQPVTGLDEFIHDYQALRQDKPKEAIVLVVLKVDGSTQTIRIEPPQ